MTPELTTARWRAVATALAVLDLDQAEAVLGLELMLDVAEAVSSTRGEPYGGDELAKAADALLHRRP